MNLTRANRLLKAIDAARAELLLSPHERSRDIEHELAMATLALAHDVEQCEAMAPPVVIVDTNAPTLPPPNLEDSRVTLPGVEAAE